MANNGAKRYVSPAYERAEAIAQSLEKHGVDADVVVLDSLIADYAKKNRIRYAIRGLRSVTDYNYEEELANYNKILNPDLETVYFRADSNVSSSFVRELLNYGKDVSDYVP